MADSSLPDARRSMTASSACGPARGASGGWADGVVEGDLLQEGWGAALGYPGFRPRAGGDAVEVQVLTAPSLESAWPDLDRFEGPGYERILVPVFGTDSGPGRAGERRLRTVANLYAATEGGPGAAAGG